MWRTLVGELCAGSCVGGAARGAVWGNCVRELGGAVCVGLWGGGHAHQSPDGPGIHTPLPPNSKYGYKHRLTFPCISRSGSGESTNLLLLFTLALLLFTLA